MYFSTHTHYEQLDNLRIFNRGAHQHRAKLEFSASSRQILNPRRFQGQPLHGPTKTRIRPARPRHLRGLRQTQGGIRKERQDVHRRTCGCQGQVRKEESQGYVHTCERVQCGGDSECSPEAGHDVTATSPDSYAPFDSLLCGRLGPLRGAISGRLPHRVSPERPIPNRALDEVRQERQERGHLTPEGSYAAPVTSIGTQRQSLLPTPCLFREVGQDRSPR